MTTSGGESPSSLLSRFDELERNATVLFEASEDKFLKFVLNAGLNRRRWEHAELECQRLSIELTRASQEVTTLEQKLSNARNMLDAEASSRKKAENERDRVVQQLQLLRQLVLDDHLLDEETVNKIRHNVGERSELFHFFSPAAAGAGAFTDTFPTMPPGILKKANLTEASVCDVDDLSFDDTQELCNSRSWLGETGDRRRRSGKRSHSTGCRKSGEQQYGNILENIASPRREKPITTIESAQKRPRRSRSVVAFEEPKQSSEDSSSVDSAVSSQRPRAYTTPNREEEKNMRPRRSLRKPSFLSQTPVNRRLSSIDSGNMLSAGGAAVSSGVHNFCQKTVIKPEKCWACDKRIKFGKLSVRCLGCRVILHTECSDRAPQFCARGGAGGGGGAGSPDVCRTPGQTPRGPGTTARPYFASPMLN